MSDSGGAFSFQPFFSVHAADPDVGRTIGRYRLTGLIAYGGMGKVFEAERADLEKRVAFKLARHSLRGKARRWFEEEGRIHAQLEHPSIAVLYDAGTVEDGSPDAGRPYFVMEYVDGRPIDGFCDHRRLSTRERLRLFLKVCSAVEYAHRHLIVHLDLKPGNILVTATGKPKLLDFGIARLLEAEREADRQGQKRGRRPMTFQYASPEQFRGEAVSVASDLYSLGMVLYKLLVGRLPYRLHPFDSEDEIGRVVCDIEPPAPSTMVAARKEISRTSDRVEALDSEQLAEPRATTPRKLRKILAGDLDRIVLKALHKDPGARYGSVRDLADDISRFLEHRPVFASGDVGFGYRSARFVRRNWPRLTIGALFVSVILSASIATTVLWRRAESALGRAEKASQFLEDLIRDVKPDQTRGEELTVHQLLDSRWRRVFVDLADEPELQLDMAGTLGEVFRELGDHETTADLLEGALDVARRHYRGDHPEVLKRLSNAGVSRFDRGHYAEAEGLFREALAMGSRLGRSPAELFRTQGNLATSLMMQGKFGEAEALYLDVQQARMALYAPRYGPDDPDLATSHRSLGTLYYASGELTKAERYARESLAIRRSIYGAEDTKVASVLDLLGNVLAAQGRRRDSETLLQEALNIRRRRLGDDHLKVARTNVNLAALIVGDDPATAQILVSQALGVYRRSRRGGWQMAVAESVLGQVLLEQGRLDEAEVCLRESAETVREIRGETSIYARKAGHRLAGLEGLPRKRSPDPRPLQETAVGGKNRSPGLHTTIPDHQE